MASFPSWEMTVTLTLNFLQMGQALEADAVEIWGGSLVVQRERK
jgi:hypothetical protein